MVTRRGFLTRTAPLALAPWLAGCDGGKGRRAPNVPSVLTPIVPGTRFRFLHGVASGDPLSTAIILWTRVTPEAPASEAVVDAFSSGGSAADAGTEGPVAAITGVSVHWRLAHDEGLTLVVQEGWIETDSDRDFTVKIDVQGLNPGAVYHYQFRTADAASPIGRTRTAPDGDVSRWRAAVTSCANHPYGYFHAYRKIAERTDLDLVLYLGDYIYEFGNGTYGDGTALGRIPDPDREIITLEDYRRRHAQYKRDPDLQEVHRRHPAVAVWDDHEIADNAWRDGAKNHREGAEGDYGERKRAAIRAFHEWLPIRAVEPQHPERIYRRFSFGDLVDLIMLDTRLIGRDRDIDDRCDAEQANDPGRSLLGAEQEGWLFAELGASTRRGARWRFLGQQVTFAQFLGDPPVRGCLRSVDKWSAYGASRTRLLDAIEIGAIDNVVILTGDAHSSWAVDVARDPFDAGAYDPVNGRGSLAIELIAPGVTSPAIADPLEALASGQRYKSTHPHIKFSQQHDQGYVVVDVTRERLRAEWYFVSSVREPAASERLGGAVVALAGRNHLSLEPSVSG
jgi:alkaline phosphatase D